MRRLVLVVSALLVSAGTLHADWLIFKTGQANQVLAVELTERAVNTVTLTGEPWSVLRDAVDIPRTRRANCMEGETRHSPGWVVMIGVPGEPSPPPSSTTNPPVAVSVPVQDVQDVQDVRVEDVQVAPRMPPPPQPELPPLPPRAPRTVVLTPPPRLPVPTSQQHRFAVYVNGAVGTEQVRFEETQSFELFSEQASIDSLYRDPKQQGVEVGGFYRVRGPFGVSGAVEFYQNQRDAVYSASIPHPFYFDRFRQISGAESGLTSEEAAAHLDAFVTKTWGPISVDVFGGPSWFFTKTELLVDVLYDEAFPFDTVVPLGTQLQIFESRPIGFNVGASATYRLGSIFGLDLGLRYSKAETTLIVDDGREIRLDAGGLRLGAGLRFLFP